MTDFRVAREDSSEGQWTAGIERVTSKAPSALYLSLALGSMAASLGFMAAGRRHDSLFVGQWAAPFLLMGIYNKMVKQHGSDASREGGQQFSTAA